MIEVICTALLIYALLLVVRMVLTWFPIDPDGAVAAFAGLLFMLTDPVLRPLRRMIPPVRIGSVALDLSALIVLIGIQIIRGALGC